MSVTQNGLLTVETTSRENIHYSQLSLAANSVVLTDLLLIVCGRRRKRDVSEGRKEVAAGEQTNNHPFPSVQRT